MNQKEFRVKLSDWIEANGKNQVPTWRALGQNGSWSIYGNIVEFCQIEVEDWRNDDKWMVDGVKIKHVGGDYKFSISEVDLYLPLSLLYEKGTLRNIKIDEIVDGH